MMQMTRMTTTQRIIPHIVVVLLSLLVSWLFDGSSDCAMRATSVTSCDEIETKGEGISEVFSSKAFSLAGLDDWLLFF